MEVQSYLARLRRSWHIIAICGLAGLIVGGAFVVFRAPTFSSTATSFVSVGSASSASDLSQGNSFSEQIISSYASIATTPKVLGPVARQLHVQGGAAALADVVSADATVGSVLLNVSASDASPARAAEIANLVSDQLAKVVGQLNPAATSQDAQVKITLVRPGVASVSTAEPSVLRTTVIGGLLGLFLAVFAILTLHRFDDRVRSKSDVGSVSDAPILSWVPRDASVSSRPLAVAASQTGSFTEAFKTLRTNLRFASVDSTIHSLVLTSAAPAEGKSVTAANLAIAFAEAGVRTVLVDGDLRRPRVADYFGFDGQVGLTNLLLDEVPLSDALQPWGADLELEVLPAGPLPPNPAELLQSNKMQELLSVLLAQFEMVVFDAPPVGPVSDALTLARFCDGAVIVCATGRTRSSQLDRAISSVEQVHASVIGVVMTFASKREADERDYAQYSQYENLS